MLHILRTRLTRRALGRDRRRRRASSCSTSASRAASRRPRAAAPWCRSGDVSASTAATSSACASGMEQRYREALGDQFDAERGAQLPRRTRPPARLLRSAPPRLAGRAAGPHASSDAEIREYLRELAGWSDADGQARPRAPSPHYAEREFGSVRALPGAAARRPARREDRPPDLGTAPRVSDAEVRDALRYQLEEVKIAAVKFDGRALPAGVERA